MPVVINEFEAVAEPPRARSGDDASSAKPSDHEEIEPSDVMPILRALELRALRAWAH